MEARSGIGLVLAIVLALVLALVGLVITRQERDEARRVTVAAPPPSSLASTDTVDPRHEPVNELPEGDPDANELEPARSRPAGRKGRSNYRDWAAKNPEGVLEVLVLLGREPLEGATVRVRPTQTGEMFESPLPVADERVAFTTSEGLALFDGMAPAHYMIGVQTRDGVLVTTYQLLRAGRPTSRQIVALGAGGVMGHVWAVDGKPLVDSRVLVNIAPPNGAARVCVVTETDEAGSYRLGGLHEGRGRVFSQLGRSIDVEIDANAWVSADFGSALQPVTWRGTLRGASGAPCDGLERIVASEIGDGEGYVVDVRAGGAFELVLPPANYRVWATGEPELELGVIELTQDLAGGKFARDLSVPGVLLAGRVQAVGEDIDPEVELEITLEREGEPNSRRACRTRVGGRYVFAGLEPGRWVVTCEPLELLGARAHGLEVNLSDKRDRTTLDLLVGAK